MGVFPDWEKFATVQRRPMTGCIPTGYEFLLRACGIQGIDFDSFQDEFDLDYRQPLSPENPSQNHFGPVSRAINAKYPQVKFETITFDPGKGNEKLAFVEERI